MGLLHVAQNGAVLPQKQRWAVLTATRCSWKAKCGAEGWASSSCRSYSWWPTGEGGRGSLWAGSSAPPALISGVKTGLFDAVLPSDRPHPRSTQMKKVMLTVFKHNHGAYQFFREALQ